MFWASTQWTVWEFSNSLLQQNLSNIWEMIMFKCSSASCATSWVHDSVTRCIQFLGQTRHIWKVFCLIWEVTGGGSQPSLPVHAHLQPWMSTLTYQQNIFTNKNLQGLRVCNCLMLLKQQPNLWEYFKQSLGMQFCTLSYFANRMT